MRRNEGYCILMHGIYCCPSRGLCTWSSAPTTAPVWAGWEPKVDCSMEEVRRVGASPPHSPAVLLSLLSQPSSSSAYGVSLPSFSSSSSRVSSFLKTSYSSRVE